MNNILITDTSLKEATLKETAILSFKEKLEISKRLLELNVDVIEVSSISKDKTNDVFVKTLSAQTGNTILSCLCESSKEGIDKAYSLLSNAKRKRLLLSFPVSPLQMEYFAGKKPQAVLEIVKELTAYAKSLNADVEVAFEDATRAEPTFLMSAILTAIEEGATAITLCDNSGHLFPTEFTAFLKSVIDSVTDISKVDLFVQACNDFSMAVATSFCGILSGANGIKTCAIPSNLTPSLLEVITTMNTLGEKHHLSTKLLKTESVRILRQISSLSMPRGKNSAFGEITEKEGEEFNKSTTQAVLSKAIKKRGYDLSADDINKVYEEFSRLAEKKESVNLEELETIIASTALQVPETYRLKNFIINSGNNIISTASLTLERDGEEVYALSSGNGSVDAVFLAIETVTGRHFELDDFYVRAVTEGKEAMGEAIVKIISDGKLYSGKGISTDIVGASVRAYLNALNKIIYEEKN